MRARSIVLASASTMWVVASACARAPQPDAYGNVEAVTITVAAQAAGQLQALTVREGQTVQAGEVVGAIDAEALRLERAQLTAQQDATAARLAEVDRQVEVVEAQRAALEAQRAAAAAQRGVLVANRDLAQRSYDRIAILFGQQAATVQQRDQAERDLKAADEQLRAQDEQIAAVARQIDAVTAQIAATRAQRVSVQRQIAAAGAQVARAEERVGKADIRNPADGTVLVRYADPGEVVQPGQALYSVADLRTVDVRAYVSERQLAGLRLGQSARIEFDRGGARQAIDGTVSWISSQAEFTPTPIQTRDERTDLVYAVKLSVPNDGGVLKIGMPVDVTFGAVP